MDVNEAKDKIVIRDAASSDIDSMITIVWRAYAPDASLPQMIPDSPAVREWWANTYQCALKDELSHLLVAVDGAKIVGILTMHYTDPDFPSSISQSVISAIPLTPDHSPLLAEALVNLKQERKEVMTDEPHYLIELVGVDSNYKSFGIGRRLTQRACKIADEKDAAIYLQTSAAKDYYLRKLGLGFEMVEGSTEDGAGGSIVRPRRPRRDDLKGSESRVSP